MKLIYFVSITICISLSIDVCRSQALNGFPQPKAIRDNAGYFQQEIVYPGGSGNLIAPHHQHIQNPILPPTIQANTISVAVPLRPQPVVTSPGTSAPLEQEPIVVRTQPQLAAPDTSFVRSTANRHKLVNIAPIPLPPSPATLSTTLRPRTTTEPETSEELEEQAKSAYYKFGTSVHDTINDHEHVRQEVREGLALRGMYSYSDGFFRRTVHYEADEGGYRVVKEEIEPVGDGEGPKFNPNGQAAVKSTLTGDYSITVDDFKLNKKQEEAIALNNQNST